MSQTPQNTFTIGPLGSIYLKTALPIIFVMGMNGLLSVADALFLGLYVGPDALAAVTLMFPMYMVIVALSTLVANGMSSLLARALGAEDIQTARGIFAGAHGLALLMSLCLILLFWIFGSQISLLAASGAADLAQMGLTYLRITVLFSPLLFVLSVNSDALRNEGRVGFMAAMSLLVSIANIGFNYLLIAVFDMGVAGSAYGTVAAQALAFSIVASFRMRRATPLPLSTLKTHTLMAHWGRILSLGAPQSLSFIGLALGSAAIIAALQIYGGAHFESTVSAYGILTRVMTFAFLPLLGLSFAMQTITGSNFGASLWERSNLSLKIALSSALIYCATAQVIFTLWPAQIGSAFVEDANVIRDVARILPIMTCMFFLSGPLMMLAAYFQAIGSARMAAALSLSKPYIFAIPLTFLMPKLLGEAGIWYAGPLSELLLLSLTLALLRIITRRTSMRWGLFQTKAGAAL